MAPKKIIRGKRPAAELRRQAEEKLGTQKKTAQPVMEADTRRLVHELQVHQIELEMQNEELMQSRAETEVALRQYTDLYDFAPVGYFTLAGDGTIRQVNLAGANLLGVERGKLIKRRFGLFVSVESRPAFSAFLEKVFTSGNKEACETALLKKGADPLWVHVEANTEYMQECLVVVVDITERKRVEEALRETDEALQALIHASPVSIVALDPDGNVKRWTPASERIFGWSEAEVLGRFLPFVPKDKLDEHRALRQRVLRGESFDGVEVHRLKKDGSPIEISLSTAPLRDALGNITGIMSVNVDITERKRVEETLRRNALLIRQSRDIILFIRRDDGRILDANEAALLAYGYIRDELLALTIGDLRAPATRGVISDQMAQANHLGILFETDHQRKDGSTFPVEVSSQGATVEGTRMLISVIRDITERKQAEEASHAAKNLLDKIFASLDEAVLVVDPNTRTVIACNPVVERIFGYGEQDVIGRNTEFLHVDRSWYERFGRELFPALEADGVFHTEFQMRRKDGSVFFTENTVREIPDDLGRRTAVVSVVRDITERKRAEQEIISLAKFPSENPGPVIRLSRDGIVMYANAASGALLSMWRCVVGGSAPQFWRDLAAQSLARSENETVDVECDGKVYSMFVTPVAESGYVNLYGRDITERERAEKRVRRQLEHLTALGSIDRFIASVFDLNLVLSEILTHVTKELGIDAADILMLNPNSKILEYSAEHGFRTNAIKKAQVRLGESYAGRAAKERQLVQIPNLRDDPDNLFLTTHLRDENFVCYYGVPLIFKGKLKGVLEVFHRAALEPDEEWFNFLFALAGQAAIAIESSTLFESLQRSSTELAMAYDATIEGWSRALDLRDKETEGHTQRVTEMTITLARTFGLSEDELVNVRWGTLLHDIGKMGVQDAILLKPGPLTDEEWVAMKKHPTFAYEMISPIHYLRRALDIPFCHHEKWDGSGYPRGLKSVQIPLVARIFAVVDVWDALMSDRPYRPAWPEEKVLDHLQSLSGTHFDPQVVKICLESGLLKGQKRP